MKVEELKIYLGDRRLSKMDFSLAYREDKSGIQKEDQLSSYFLIVTLFLGLKGIDWKPIGLQLTFLVSGRNRR